MVPRIQRKTNLSRCHKRTELLNVAGGGSNAFEVFSQVLPLELEIELSGHVYRLIRGQLADHVEHKASALIVECQFRFCRGNQYDDSAKP